MGCQPLIGSIAYLTAEYDVRRQMLRQLRWQFVLIIRGWEVKANSDFIIKIKIQKQATGQAMYKQVIREQGYNH